jgi:hypothetical protein
MLLGVNVTPPLRSTLVGGIETNRAKFGNVLQDTEWRLNLPVTVIKSCETSGEIYKGKDFFNFSHPKTIGESFSNALMRHYFSNE